MNISTDPDKADFRRHHGRDRRRRRNLGLRVPGRRFADAQAPRSLPALFLALAAILALLAAPAAAKVAPPMESPFVDVPTDHPYFLAIYSLWQLDVIDGYPVGEGTAEFRPQNPVARQHFTKMIVRGMSVAVSEADVCTFPDVDVSGPSDLYPDNYIAAAYRDGVVRGMSPSTFNPFGSIKRAQLISMVVRAIRTYSTAPLKEPDAGYHGYMRGFDDPTHGHNVQVAEHNGLLEGIPLEGWDPWRNASRGEVAQILYNSIHFQPPTK